MPDTGASQSIVSATIARDANLSVRPTMTELCNASNGKMTLVGEADIVLCNEKHSARTVVLIASDLNHSALIGWQDLQKLRVIPASFPAVAAVAQCFRDLKTKTLLVFPAVFSDVCSKNENISQRQQCALSSISSTPNSSSLSRTCQL